MSLIDENLAFWTELRDRLRTKMAELDRQGTPLHAADRICLDMADKYVARYVTAKLTGALPDDES